MPSCMKDKKANSRHFFLQQIAKVLAPSFVLPYLVPTSQLCSQCGALPATTNDYPNFQIHSKANYVGRELHTVTLDISPINIKDQGLLNFSDVNHQFEFFVGVMLFSILIVKLKKQKNNKIKILKVIIYNLLNLQIKILTS